MRPLIRNLSKSVANSTNSHSTHTHTPRSTKMKYTCFIHIQLDSYIVLRFYFNPHLWSATMIQNRTEFEWLSIEFFLFNSDAVHTMTSVIRVDQTNCFSESIPNRLLHKSINKWNNIDVIYNKFTRNYTKSSFSCSSLFQKAIQLILLWTVSNWYQKRGNFLFNFSLFIFLCLFLTYFFVFFFFGFRLRSWHQNNYTVWIKCLHNVFFIAFF